MDHIIKQLKKGAKHTHLSATEKAEMKSVLLRHVKANPAQNEILLTRATPSPFFSIYNFRNKKTLPILVIAGLLMGSSVSFAAENTVPGDVLYPIKIQVNERVLGAVAVTPKAQAAWDVRLVERRLEEVERIAVTPGVLLEVQQITQSNLEKYTNRVKARVAKFEQDEDSEDAIITAEGLANTLRNHEGLLVGLNVQTVGSYTTNGETATSSVEEINLPAEATTNTTATVSTTNTSLLRSVLSLLHAERGDAEKKHKELEHKYHPKVRQSDENQNEEETDNNKEVVLGTADSPFEAGEDGKVVDGSLKMSTKSTTENSALIPVNYSFGKENILEARDSQEIRSAVESATVSAVSTGATPVLGATMITEIHSEVSKKLKDND